MAATYSTLYFNQAGTRPRRVRAESRLTRGSRCAHIDGCQTTITSATEGTLNRRSLLPRTGGTIDRCNQYKFLKGTDLELFHEQHKDIEREFRPCS